MRRGRYTGLRSVHNIDKAGSGSKIILILFFLSSNRGVRLFSVSAYLPRVDSVSELPLYTREDSSAATEKVDRIADIELSPTLDGWSRCW